MKKSFVLRSLQVVLAVSIYSATYIWAANTHAGSVFSILNGLDEFLLVLALAVIFPYLCFKGLSKLTTRPDSLDEEKLPKSKAIDQDLDSDIDLKTMQYRGIAYYPDGSESLPASSDVADEPRVVTVTKYRGVQIGDPNIESTSDSKDSSAISTSFAEERQQQKSARPKERIKYRGAYID